MFADALAKTLADQGVDVERSGSASATTTADVLLPDLIVLAADAAQRRGAAVLEQLRAQGRATATLVICAAEPGGSVSRTASRHVAYVEPEGDAVACARRVRALLSALPGDQGSSLQQLVDRVAKATTTTSGAQPKAAGRTKTQSGVGAPLRMPSPEPQAVAKVGSSSATGKADLRETARPTKPEAQAAGGRLLTAQDKSAGLRETTRPKKPEQGSSAELRETVRPKMPGTQPAGLAAGGLPTTPSKSADLKQPKLGKLTGGPEPAAPSKSADAVQFVGAAKVTAPLKMPKPGSASAPRKPLQVNKLPELSQAPASRITVRPTEAPAPLKVPNTSSAPRAQLQTDNAVDVSPVAQTRSADKASVASEATSRTPASIDKSPGQGGADISVAAAPPMAATRARSLRNVTPGGGVPGAVAKVAGSTASASEPKATAPIRAAVRRAAAAPALQPMASAAPIVSAATGKLPAPVGDVAPPELRSSTRASEIEIAITMSDPPSARVEAVSQSDAGSTRAMRLRPQGPPTLPKAAVKPSPALDEERLSELEVLPELGGVVVTGRAVQPTAAARAEQIEASAFDAAHMAATPSPTAAMNASTIGAAREATAGSLGEPLVGTAGAALSTSASGELAQSPPLAAAAHHPELASTTDRSLRQPVEPAARATRSATSPNRSVGRSAAPSRAPRYPFEPAARAADISIGATGASGPSAAPGRAPRDPFAPAARLIDAAISASGPTATGRHAGGPSAAPGRAPYDPFAPAARVAEAAMNASGPNAASGRAPRDPFAPAARAAEPRGVTGDVAAAAPAGEPPPLATTRGAAKSTGRAGRVPSDLTLSEGQQPRGAEATQRPRTPPLGLPSVGLSPETVAASKPRRMGGIWLLGALAAIGGSASWLYHIYDGSAATAPGNPATGSLVQTPVLANPQEPLVAHPVEPVPVLAQPIATEAPAAPAPAPERRTGPARSTGESHDTDPSTATGRARALVDSGSAMLRQGRYGLAEGMYMKAMQEVSEFPPAMADLVRVHLARRDGVEAVRWAERLVAKQDNALHQLLLGDALALRGNHSAAEAAWTKAANGGNPSARKRLEGQE